MKTPTCLIHTSCLGHGPRRCGIPGTCRPKSGTVERWARPEARSSHTAALCDTSLLWKEAELTNVCVCGLPFFHGDNGIAWCRGAVTCVGPLVCQFQNDTILKSRLLDSCFSALNSECCRTPMRTWAWAFPTTPTWGKFGLNERRRRGLAGRRTRIH